jgi:hypothetical protein
LALARSYGGSASEIKSLKQGVSRRLIGEAEYFRQERYYDFNVRITINLSKGCGIAVYSPRSGEERLGEAPEHWKWSSFATIRLDMKDAWRLSLNLHPHPECRKSSLTGGGEQ